MLKDALATDTIYECDDKHAKSLLKRILLRNHFRKALASWAETHDAEASGTSQTTDSGRLDSTISDSIPSMDTPGCTKGRGSDQISDLDGTLHAGVDTRLDNVVSYDIPVEIYPGRPDTPTPDHPLNDYSTRLTGYNDSLSDIAIYNTRMTVSSEGGQNTAYDWLPVDDSTSHTSLNNPWGDGTIYDIPATIPLGSFQYAKFEQPLIDASTLHATDIELICESMDSMFRESFYRERTRLHVYFRQYPLIEASHEVTTDMAVAQSEEEISDESAWDNRFLGLQALRGTVSEERAAGSWDDEDDEDDEDDDMEGGTRTERVRRHTL